jgi:hypothetical protein
MSQSGPLNDQGSGPTPPDVPTEFVTNSGTAVPALNVIEILGSGSISTSGSGNVVTISISSTGYTWNTITSATNPTQIVAENAYITAGVSQCVLVLPLTASVGDAFIVTGLTSLFQITQNANQSIIFGMLTTTTGVTGSITSTGSGDHVTIVCVQTNLVWKVIDSMANLTVV